MARSLLLILLGTLLTLDAVHAREPVLDRIRTTGRIVLGYAENSPPFSFSDKTGTPSGFSVDLCRAIADQAKRQLKMPDLKIEYVPVQSDDRVAAIVNGRVDIECGTTTNTLGRQQDVDFTLFTFVTGGTLLSRKSDPVQSLEKIGGKKVAVTRGTTTQRALEEFLTKSRMEAEIVTVESHQAGMALLDAREVQVFASDRVVLMGQMMESKDRNDYLLSDDFFSYEPYALMVPRNDADFRLLANRALSRIYSSNQIGILYKKWFGVIDNRPSGLLMAVYQLQALSE